MSFRYRRNLRTLAAVAKAQGQGRGRQRKFRNQVTTCSLGHEHDSKLEASVCQQQQLRVAAGEIEIVATQERVLLTDAQIEYRPDWTCRDRRNGELFWAEAKGRADQKWPIKKKLWKYYGPGRLEIWKGDHRNPVLIETIIPIRKEVSTNA